MELVLEIWNWISFDKDGGSEYVLSLTSWNLKSLSLLIIVYLFRNICFRLLVEDSYNCCRYCMRIMRIEIIFSFNYIEHYLTFTLEMFIGLRKLGNLGNMYCLVEISWHEYPLWKSYAPCVYIGVNPTDEIFVKWQ